MYTECFAPSRSNSQPWDSRSRKRSRRFTLLEAGGVLVWRQCLAFLVSPGCDSPQWRVEPLPRDSPWPPRGSHLEYSPRGAPRQSRYNLHSPSERQL